LSSTIEIKLPRSIFKRIVSEAEKRGISLEEYIVELVLKDLDPLERAREYLAVAQELLIQAGEELSKNNIRQAAEKLWGAAALSIKAHAYWKEGRRLTSHGELWRYKDVLSEELGEWVRDAWMYANSMHTCFYEGWCSEKDVAAAIKYMEKLVNSIRDKIVKSK
jgi:hypothetical protein